MITKKKILQHILWGGVFGLIGGAIISGIKFVNYAPTYQRFYSKMNTKISWLPEPNPYFSHNVSYLIYFLVPALLIGLAIGISSRSFKKMSYGVIGGMLGGLVAYWLHSFEVVKTLVYVFPSVIYTIFITLLIGIGNRFFKKIIGGIVSGVIASIPIGILTIIFIFIGAGLDWNAPSYSDLMYIPMQFFTVTILTVAIYIGTEWGQRCE